MIHHDDTAERAVLGAEYGTTNRDAGMEVYGGVPLHQLARKTR